MFIITINHLYQLLIFIITKIVEPNRISLLLDIRKQFQKVLFPTPQLVRADFEPAFSDSESVGLFCSWHCILVFSLVKLSKERSSGNLGLKVLNWGTMILVDRRGLNKLDGGTSLFLKQKCYQKEPRSVFFKIYWRKGKKILELFEELN